MPAADKTTADLLDFVAWTLACFAQGYNSDGKSGLYELAAKIDKADPRHPLADRWIAVLGQCERWNSGADRRNAGANGGRRDMGRALYELHQSIARNDPAPLSQLRPDPDGEGLQYTFSPNSYPIPASPPAVGAA